MYNLLLLLAARPRTVGVSFLSCTLFWVVSCDCNPPGNFIIIINYYRYAGFYITATIGLLAGYARTKNPAMLGPIIPFTFLVGYQADMALGNKMERILSEWVE